MEIKEIKYVVLIVAVVSNSLIKFQTLHSNEKNNVYVDVRLQADHSWKCCSLFWSISFYSFGVKSPLLRYWYLFFSTTHLICPPHVVLRPSALSSQIKNTHIFLSPVTKKKEMHTHKLLKIKSVRTTAQTHKHRTP